ncbi:MAG: S-layer protein [Planctomycetaceae bacterium]|nr:MAG: S-layer protein [Planctomycetaceae bacterium]
MPVLSVAGCSDIRCHGAPSGKDGFRLSLWGFDPEFDFQQLTHDGLGRRTNTLNPDNSLVLNKALSQVPHVGGRRFAPRSHLANLIRTWQSEGLRDDRKPVSLAKLTVTPDRRVLKAPAVGQRLAVSAKFSDGRVQDVTRLTTFSSSDIAIASVDRSGQVEFNRQGEVAILCRFMGRLESVRMMHIAEPAAGYAWPNPPEANYVDTHVFAKLKMLNIAPSELCTDEQFVRRLYLDLCGVLPTPGEVRAFLATGGPDKRARLIEQLLQRPEYADYWTKKWFDVLRVTRDAINLEGSQKFQAWLRNRIEGDAPFDDTVRQMLTSTGQSYRDAPVNFFCVTMTPKTITDKQFLQKDLAEATAQLFLGVRLQCAKCHNHPYERWTQNDYLGLAAHFSQVKRTRMGKAGPGGRAERRQIEITIDKKAAEFTRDADGSAVVPSLIGQEPKPIPADKDRRDLLASWLTKLDNPYFAKAFVNRVWYHLNGRGVVEPVDDFRDSNPSSNDPLLEALAAEFVSSGYRLRPLIRSIVNSRTYQLSPISNTSNRGDKRYFSHMHARPLPAEVLLDPCLQRDGRARDVRDRQGLHDRSASRDDQVADWHPGGAVARQRHRDVDQHGIEVRALRVASVPESLRQPSRTQTCECDREQTFGRKQALELIIGQMMSKRLVDPTNRLSRMLAAGSPDAEILDTLYLRALSRRPSPKTRTAMLAHVGNSPTSDRRGKTYSGRC